jgi:hypothetical protein
MIGSGSAGAPNFTWNARILHETAAVLRDESEIDGENGFVVDDAADSVNAISVELLRLVNVGAVFAEELASVVVVDFIKLSFRRKRHENDLNDAGREIRSEICLD